MNVELSAHRLRQTLALVLLTLADIAVAGGGKHASWNTWTHTRPLSGGAIALIEEAQRRSMIVASMLKELEATDIVVYVSDSMPGTVGGPASSLVFQAIEGKTRYVVVRVDSWRLSPCERIEWLGHELQHALEVAAAPEVVSADTLAQLYKRIGWSSGNNQYESEGARMAGIRVRNQLDRQ